MTVIDFPGGWKAQVDEQITQAEKAAEGQASDGISDDERENLRLFAVAVTLGCIIALYRHLPIAAMLEIVRQYRAENVVNDMQAACLTGTVYGLYGVKP